jgi:hypothetical protein
MRKEMESGIAKKAVDLYGGKDLWSTTKYIAADVSTKGWAFVLKGRPFFDHAQLFMRVDKTFCKIKPIGKNHDISGVLDGADVRLENLQGEVMAERKNARDYFTVGRRLFYWDDLDMAYFANYAFWNYFTFPALLMNSKIIWKKTSNTTLQAIFPDSIPTHSRVQEFRFDAENGLLQQHNYTADIISRFAKAANVVLRHKKNNGVLYPARRRVTPRTWAGNPLRGPVLIDIEVHDFKLANSPQACFSPASKGG